MPVYERAYEAFRRGEWREALDGFRAVIATRGDDGPSAHFARLCEEKPAASPAAPKIALPTTRSGA